MEEYKEKALELFNINLDRFFSAELSDVKNRGTAKANTIFWVEQIIGQWEYIDTYLADLNGELNPNLRYWYKILEQIKQIRI